MNITKQNEQTDMIMIIIMNMDIGQEINTSIT